MRPVLQRVLIALGLAASLSACLHSPAPQYQPGNANLTLLRAQPEAKLAVDAFQATGKVENSRLGLRGNSMTGAGDGTFSTYLQQALEAELRNANRLDPDAKLRLSGELLENKLDASSGSTGRASIQARFVLTRDGKVVYDKPLRAEHEWKSSFMGAIAVPAAMENYVATVQKLVGLLVADPDFVEATR